MYGAGTLARESSRFLHHGATLLAPGEWIPAAQEMSARGEFVYGESGNQLDFFADRAG